MYNKTFLRWVDEFRLSVKNSHNETCYCIEFITADTQRCWKREDITVVSVQLSNRI